MARVVKTRGYSERHILLRLHTDDPPSWSVPGEINLIRGGKRAYFWVGSQGGHIGTTYTVSGVVALRKLAQAILKELPRAKGRGSK